MSDFINYVITFEEMPDIFHLTSFRGFERIEPGFVIYTSIIKLFTDNYFAWVAINTLIDLIVFAWFFKRYCQSMILPLVFFIAFNGLLIEFNLYRNIKAIDLFLLSIPYLEKRKIVPYMLLNLLGVMFHNSALLFLPLYFVLTLRMSMAVIWSGFVISNLVFLLHISIIGDIINNLSFMQNMVAYDKIMGYANRAEVNELSFGYIERTLTFILFYWQFKKIVSRYPAYVIFYNCFWIYYCSTLIFYEVVVFVERIPYLFMFTYWVIYPRVLEIKSYYQNVIKIAVAMLVVMKIMASYRSLGSAYSNVMFSEPNYKERKAVVLKEFRNR